MQRREYEKLMAEAKKLHAEAIRKAGVLYEESVAAIDRVWEMSCSLSKPKSPNVGRNQGGIADIVRKSIVDMRHESFNAQQVAEFVSKTTGHQSEKIKDAVSTALRRMAVNKEIYTKHLGAGKRGTEYQLINKPNNSVVVKLDREAATAIIQARNNHVQHVQDGSLRPRQTVKFVTGTRGATGNT